MIPDLFPPTSNTLMFDEAGQAADVVRNQWDLNASTIARITKRLQQVPPRLVATCARGSSDHAATYARYLTEQSGGPLTTSIPPSLSSVYGISRDFSGCLVLLISQSGGSPDLLAVAEDARKRGALVVAICNRIDSPLARASDEVIAIGAGLESSVAATKSFIGSVAAVMHLVAVWQKRDALLRALEKAPDLLAQAWEQDWSPAMETLSRVAGLFVVGRGLGLGIAEEAALKFKEVCGLHGEAFSAAEVLHGPVTLTCESFPVLLFTQRDDTHQQMTRLMETLVARGVPVLGAGSAPAGAVCLPSPDAHPAVAPMLQIQSFYRMANALSVSRGLNPDKPRYLRKVTATH